MESVDVDGYGKSKQGFFVSSPSARGLPIRSQTVGIKPLNVLPRRQQVAVAKERLAEQNEREGVDGVTENVDELLERLDKRKPTDTLIEIITENPHDPMARSMSAATYKSMATDQEARTSAAIAQYKRAPINPLYTIPTKSALPKAARQMASKSILSTQSQKARAFKISEEETAKIVDRVIDEKFWWAPAWRLIRRSFDYAKWKKRETIVGLVVLLSFVFQNILIWLLYRYEIDDFQQLSLEDQRAYRHLLWTIRVGALQEMFNKEMESFDPLKTLPRPKRLHHFIEVCRGKGLLDTNVEEEQRKWPDFFAQPDIYHALFWHTMWWGPWLNGRSPVGYNIYSIDNLSEEGTITDLPKLMENPLRKAE